MKYTLWNDQKVSVPTIYIHSFVGNGEDVWKAAHEMNCPPFNLVAIHDFNGDYDLTPWEAANVWKGQPPFAGNAMEHLKEISEELVPEIEACLPAPSSYRCMVGYSLAGLFTMWTCWQSSVFERIACVSASFWYPDFIEFISMNSMMYIPKAIYFSLGDKESKTKHPLMKQVEECTKTVFSLAENLKIRTIFEMNAGNHFTEPDKRQAKAILWLLNQ